MAMAVALAVQAATLASEVEMVEMVEMAVPTVVETVVVAGAPLMEAEEREPPQRQ